MWILYGLLPALVLLALIAGAVTLIVRGKGEGWNIEFSTVMLAFAATAMLVGVFLAAAGAALLLKATFGATIERDFSYDSVPYQRYTPTGGIDGFVDPSDGAIRDDVATGVSLVFAGGVVFAVSAFAYPLLRRRDPPGEQFIVRSYNVIGLGVSSMAFLAAGAAALNDIMRRYVIDGGPVETWDIRHPGEPLAIAIVMLPIALWYGFRVWQELRDGPAPAPSVARPNGGAAAIA